MQALVYWETTQQEMVVDLRSKALLLVEVSPTGMHWRRSGSHPASPTHPLPL